MMNCFRSSVPFLLIAFAVAGLGCRKHGSETSNPSADSVRTGAADFESLMPARKACKDVYRIAEETTDSAGHLYKAIRKTDLFVFREGKGDLSTRAAAA